MAKLIAEVLEFHGNKLFEQSQLSGFPLKLDSFFQEIQADKSKLKCRMADGSEFVICIKQINCGL